MPKVPTYSRPRVSRNQLPSVRVSADAPASAFMPAKGIDFGPAMEIAGEFIQREQEKADQIAFTAAEARASALETELLHGENGALYRKGQNAFSAPEDVSAAWNKGVSQIESELKTPRQKEAFQRAAMARWNSINAQVQRHVAGERRTFDLETSKALLANEIDGAIKNYNDPERVKLSIGRTVAALSDLGARQGWGKEVTEQQVSKALTAIHSGVIDGMLAADNDMGAESYFQQHQDQISGEATVKIKQDLEEGSLRGKSQRESDKIYAENRGNQSGALDAARAIEDPKLRDEVEKRLLHRFTVDRQVERESENDTYVSAANYIDAKPGVPARTAVPPALWNTLKPTQRRSLELYADNGGGKGGGTHNGSGESSQSAWLSFLELEPDDIKGLTRSELESKYLAKLNKRDAGRAITMWKNAREGKATNDGSKEMSTLNFKDRVQSSLYRSGLIGADAKKGSTAQLDRSEKALVTKAEGDVDQEVRDFRRVKGRDPSPDELQGLVDGVIVRRVFQQSDKDAIVVRAPGFVGRLRKRSNGNAYVRIDEIPSDMVADLKRRMPNANDAKIEQAYGLYVSRNRAGLQAFINANR